MSFRGRIAMHQGDMWILFNLARECKTYIEIGTLYGGSATIAGLAGCETYCIDPLDGYYSAQNNTEMRIDWKTGLIPTAHMVRTNWAMAGFDPEKLHISQQLHPPFPDEWGAMTFDIGFIDGDHTFDGCMADIKGLRSRLNKYMLIHNMEKEPMQRAYRIAAQHPEWRPYVFDPELPTIMGVLKRCAP